LFSLIHIKILSIFQIFKGSKMEEIFSSNSGDIIQKHLDFSIQNEIILDSNESLEKYFDIDQTVAWVKDKQYKRVGLT
jgi:hypothetical protein